LALDDDNPLIDDWLKGNLPIPGLKLQAAFEYSKEKCRLNYQQSFSSASSNVITAYLDNKRSAASEKAENEYPLHLDEIVYSFLTLSEELETKIEKSYLKAGRRLTDQEITQRKIRLEQLRPIINEINQLGGVITIFDIRLIIGNLEKLVNDYSQGDIQQAKDQLTSLLTEAQEMISQLPMPSENDFRLIYWLIDDQHLINYLLNDC
jgi:hypothetical protein